MVMPTTDPAIMLHKLLYSNWAETDPAKTAIDWRLEQPRKDGTWTTQICITRPPPEVNLTSQQRGHTISPRNVGAAPQMRSKEGLMLTIQVATRGTFDAKNTITTRWNAVKHCGTLIRNNGVNYGSATDGTINAFTVQSWSNDDYQTEGPLICVSRGVIVADYWW